MEGEKQVPQLTTHFHEKEFDCRCGCGTGKISIELVQKLEQVRIDYGSPMHINSGIRCLKHNTEIGSRNTSSHIKGLAADIDCTGMGQRYKLLPILIKHFKRVGINKIFIHVDVDSDKPNGIFVY